MKTAMMRAALLLAGVSLAFSDTTRQQGVAAIQKVIQMMEDMQAKAKKEKAEEEIGFAKFDTWCTHQQKNLKSSIEKEGSQIETLTTSIGKLDEEVKELGSGISTLESQIAGHEADMKANKNTREQEHTTYLAESQDYAESVSALERAIEVMSKEDYNRDQSSAALLQLSQSSKVPEKAKDVIAAFLGYDAVSDMNEADDAIAAYSAPGDAHGYEFQSGGIIGVLKNLLDDFRKQKDDCAKEEANAKHAHDMVMQDLADTVSSAKRDSSAKSQSKSGKEAKAALDTKQKRSSEGVKKEDEGTLSDVEAECSQKSTSFTEKQQLRAEEIDAIGKAIEIMKSSDVSSFIEQAAVLGKRMLANTALAQLRSGTSTAAEGRRHDVREFITRESRRLNSKRLSLLAQTLQADPFAKVKGLIKDMMSKLLKESNEDAEHNGFCTEELAKSKNTRTQLTEDIDALTASIEDAKAEVETLAQSNKELNDGIVALNTARSEATANRADEKKRNEATIKDADAAVVAVDSAVAVLKDFYEKASKATSLVQGEGMRMQRRGIRMGSDAWDALGAPAPAPAPAGADEEKQTFGEAYKGNQDGATGVLAMIEVIRSDFGNLSADTKASEEASLKASDEFMVESKKNLAVKNKKLELNSADKAATEKKMSEDKKDLKSNSDELVAAETYHKKLEGQCIAKGSSYEDRTKARAAEIQSLKEAVKMLA